VADTGASAFGWSQAAAGSESIAGTSASSFKFSSSGTNQVFISGSGGSSFKFSMFSQVLVVGSGGSAFRWSHAAHWMTSVQREDLRERILDFFWSGRSPNL